MGSFFFKIWIVRIFLASEYHIKIFWGNTGFPKSYFYYFDSYLKMIPIHTFPISSQSMKRRVLEFEICSPNSHPEHLSTTKEHIHPLYQNEVLFFIIKVRHIYYVVKIWINYHYIIDVFFFHTIYLMRKKNNIFFRYSLEIFTWTIQSRRTKPYTYVLNYTIVLFIKLHLYL